MHRVYYFSRLVLVAFSFALVGCAANVTTPPYPNPPIVTASSTPTLPSRTPVPFGKNKQATPTRYYPPTLARDFGQGDIAEIASQDALGYSEEELFELLVSQWLEKYKTGVISNNSISDYRIDEVNIDQRPRKEYEVVARVIFSIQPNSEHLGNWATLVRKHADSTDPWDHLSTTFGIYRDGDTLKLSWIPSWGT